MENINKNENITLVASDSCEYPVFELVIELLRDPRTFNWTKDKFTLLSYFYKVFQYIGRG